MRATFLLVGSVALLFGGCAGKSNDHAPPPLDKQLLIGKWKSSAGLALVTGYDFAEGGTFQMNVAGMDKPVTGRYNWGGDRDLVLKYEANEDGKKAYAAAAKAYKDEVRQRVEQGTLPDRALPGILGTVRDELPAEATFRVGLTEKPRLLMLNTSDGVALRFERAE